MTDYRKPLPQPNVDTKEYWDGCKRHELVIQRCNDCGVYRFFPCIMCHKCGSVNSEWRRVSGKGAVYTWTVVWRPIDPVWVDELPYIVVVVELDEQPQIFLTGNLLECDPKDVKPGMPVEVVFVDVTDEITLPQWRPISHNTEARSV